MVKNSKEKDDEHETYRAQERTTNVRASNAIYDVAIGRNEIKKNYY